MAKADLTNAPVVGARPLERERELLVIKQLLDEAAAGSGVVLTIEGAAGIGKSRLLDEARRTAQALGIASLRARGDELERAHPFGVVSSLFESRFARTSPEDRERLLRGRAVLAAPLVSDVDAGIEPAGPTDEFALLHGLYWTVVNLAEEGPLALMVDDVQWADDLSLRFLIYLAQRLEDLPVALLVAIRSGDPTSSSDLVTKLSTTATKPTLRPAELSEHGVRELLGAAELNLVDFDAFAHATWKATRGNPFLVRELVASMRQEPTLGFRMDAAAVGAFAPQSVTRMVALRLARLGAAAVELARACAVLGNEASLTLAADLARIDLTEAVDAAACLQAAQILDAVEPLVFAHTMIRSAIYQELPPGWGAQTHLRAARLLADRGSGAAEVAHHLLVGTPCPEPWARDALHAAGRLAARKGAPGVALRYLTRALELDPAGTGNGPLLVDLGLVEAAAGERTSLTRFERAIAMLDEPADQARAMYALGQTQYRYGRVAEAAETFSRGAALTEAENRELLLMFEGAFMCCALQVSSIRVEAMDRLTALVHEIQDHGIPSPAERTLLAAHSCYRAFSVPPATEAAVIAHAALGDGDLVREQTSESLAVNLAIVALIMSGQPGEAQRHIEAVLADARRRGAALAFAESSMVRAIAMLAQGRLSDAMADAQAAIGGMEHGWQSLVPIPQAILAHCLVERGELDAAAGVLSEVEPRMPGADAMALNSWYFWARGGLHVARSEPEPALADYLKAGEILRSYGYINPANIPWRIPAALCARALGDGTQAERLVDDEIDLSKRFQLPAQLGSALRGQAVVRGHDLETLDRAIRMLEGARAALELARGLLDRGGILRRAGRRAESREPLRRALDLAHACGATVLEQRARDELLASGARPRRAMVSGIESLTPSERRIADLVAAGHSNRAVAETLFLTKGTVEWHLSHIYQKLDVRGREGLAELLHN
jgi:DNA-binding CsgD family transcriptional regulator